MNTMALTKKKKLQFQWGKSWYLVIQIHRRLLVTVFHKRMINTKGITYGSAIASCCDTIWITICLSLLSSVLLWPRCKKLTLLWPCQLQMCLTIFIFVRWLPFLLWHWRAKLCAERVPLVGGTTCPWSRLSGDESWPCDLWRHGPVAESGDPADSWRLLHMEFDRNHRFGTWFQVVLLADEYINWQKIRGTRMWAIISATWWGTEVDMECF